MKYFLVISIFFAISFSAKTFGMSAKKPSASPLADKTITLRHMIKHLNAMTFLEGINRNARVRLVGVLTKATELGEKMGADKRITQRSSATVLDQFNDVYNKHIETWRSDFERLKICQLAQEECE